VRTRRIDGKQLAAVLRIKALWCLNFCALCVSAGEEQELRKTMPARQWLLLRVLRTPIGAASLAESGENRDNYQSIAA
jgi:hypothetical protein